MKSRTLENLSLHDMTNVCGTTLTLYSGPVIAKEVRSEIVWNNKLISSLLIEVI